MDRHVTATSAAGLFPHLDPAVCAVVSMECQERLLGDESVLPGLAQAAADIDLVATLARLYASARSAGVRIYYCTDERRPDGFGAATNLPITGRLATSDGGPHRGGHGPVVAPIAPRPEDVVFRREQGVTAFFGTGLDGYLRSTGVRTVIITGVSLNLAVLGSTIEAANLGYTTVVATDATAAVPPEYLDAVVRNTIRHIALITTTDAIIGHWAQVGAPNS
jgi:nicotinamidase-related amidase